MLFLKANHTHPKISVSNTPSSAVVTNLVFLCSNFSNKLTKAARRFQASPGGLQQKQKKNFFV